MRTNPDSQSGLFNPRILLALVLSSVGVFLAMFSFAANETADSFANAAATIIPGFHAPVTMPGSSGGSEPSLALNKNGIRYVSWQVPGEFAKSADGVT